VMMRAGFGVGANADRPGPNLLCSDTRRIDRGLAIHAWSLRCVGIERVPWNHAYAVVFPLRGVPVIVLSALRHQPGPLAPRPPGGASRVSLVEILLLFFDHAWLPGTDHEQNHESSEQRDVLHQTCTSLSARELTEVGEVVGVECGDCDIDCEYDGGKPRANVEDDKQGEHDLNNREHD